MNPDHLALIEEFRRAAPPNFKIEFSGDVIITQASPSATELDWVMSVPFA